ncbi:MAG: hypothetical protein J0G35_11870 [Acidobacteriales bacterium]|nr:hypothetical protein [Terriglobales bacterium]
MKKFALLCLMAFTFTACQAQKPLTGRIARNSHVFIEPMDGFENYLSAAILKKKVPILITDDKAKADYIITGTSHVEKAGWAKTIFVSPRSAAGASITMKDARTGDLAFAYSVDKFNAARANQSTAEACAKHLKEAIDKK